MAWLGATDAALVAGTGRPQRARTIAYCDRRQPGKETIRSKTALKFNASVCRLLKRLDDESVIWRRENGRYYPKESRRLLDAGLGRST